MSYGLALVTLAGNDLVAVLADGRTIRHSDPIVLAEMLLREGVLADHVLMPDWREGDCAPLTGHKVALLARMRR